MPLADAFGTSPWDNPITTINYQLPAVGTQYIVSLRVYDMLGREVVTDKS